MQLRVIHTTKYTYSMVARANANELRLLPEENYRQRPGTASISVSPQPDTEIETTRDLFGNLVQTFEIEGPHGELWIQSESVTETLDCARLHQKAMEVPLQDALDVEQLDVSVHQFLTDSTFVQKDPATWREALDVKSECAPTYGALVEGLSEYIFKSCKYEDKAIHTMTTASEVQRCKAGTCQDFSHLLVGYCRALGMPARYISGYLFDPGLESGHPDYVGAEISHAWVEVFVPGLEWVGIDPTNKMWIDEHYISVAFGRDYHDVAPIRGSLQGGGKKRTLEVAVEVRAV